MASPTAKSSRGAETNDVRACRLCHAIYRAEYTRCPVDGGEIEVGFDPVIGTTLGEHYIIEALIGEGAMARVYRARHSRLATKRYAVKVLIGDLATSTEMRMRFANEAQNASHLDHPNVIGVVDCGRLYIVMDLVEGPSLGEMIRATPKLPHAQIAAIARGLARGLAHAHERGVVHRDFKPDNILMAAGFAPRIGDFGLAIRVAADEDSARLTLNGVNCTPAYAAPEQLGGRDVDHRADLYALGVTLFEMLSGGRLPFEGDTVAIVGAKIAATQPPRVEDVAPEAEPSWLGTIVERLMAREPADRYQCAEDVLAALEIMKASRHGWTSTVRPPSVLPPAPTRRGGALRKLALLAMVGAIGVGAWFVVARVPEARIDAAAASTGRGAGSPEEMAAGSTSVSAPAAPAAPASFASPSATAPAPGSPPASSASSASSTSLASPSSAAKPTSAPSAPSSSVASQASAASATRRSATAPVKRTPPPAIVPRAPAPATPQPTAMPAPPSDGGSTGPVMSPTPVTPPANDVPAPAPAPTPDAPKPPAGTALVDPFVE